MKIITVKLSELKHPDVNSRLHPEKQIRAMMDSVEQNGQLRPIVIDEDNVVWAGNGLFDAMVRLGKTEAYAYRKEGLSRRDKLKLMLADNKTFDLGVDDMSAFDKILEELSHLGTTFEIPGYDEDLLNALVADAADVDDMMSSYGIIDEVKIDEIISAKDIYAQEDEAFAKEATEYIPASVGSASRNPLAAPDVPDKDVGYIERGSIESTIEPRKYIVCPKCGERIWL